MTTLMKKNGAPFSLQNWLNDNWFSPTWWPVDLEQDSMLQIPSANIAETEKEFQIELAIPGFDKKEVKVEVKNGKLEIHSEKEEKSEKEEANYLKKEFKYNLFHRSFTLPENCNDSKINAKYENGILKVKLPKKETQISSPVKEILVN